MRGEREREREREWGQWLGERQAAIVDTVSAQESRGELGQVLNKDMLGVREEDEEDREGERWGVGRG